MIISYIGYVELLILTMSKMEVDSNMALLYEKMCKNPVVDKYKEYKSQLQSLLSFSKKYAHFTLPISVYNKLIEILEKVIVITQQEKAKAAKTMFKSKSYKRIITNYYQKIQKLPLLGKAFLNEVSLVSTPLYTKLSLSGYTGYTETNFSALRRASLTMAIPSDATNVLKEAYDQMVIKCNPLISTNNVELQGPIVNKEKSTQTITEYAKETATIQLDKLYVKVFELESLNRTMKFEISGLEGKIKEIFETIDYKITSLLPLNENVEKSCSLHCTDIHSEIVDSTRELKEHTDRIITQIRELMARFRLITGSKLFVQKNINNERRSSLAKINFKTVDSNTKQPTRYAFIIKGSSIKSHNIRSSKVCSPTSSGTPFKSRMCEAFTSTQRSSRSNSIAKTNGVVTPVYINDN